MGTHDLPRREFLKMLAAAFPAAAFDWSSYPVGRILDGDPDTYDVIIIGSGLGGLSCAAAFARQGFKSLVIEQHDKPGGYATAFSRPGGFVFDVSLHSTSVDERDGKYNLLPGFPEITSLEFLPHPSLMRAIFPEHDLRVAQRDPKAFIETLTRLFPEEAAGITGLFDDMGSLASDIRRLSSARGVVDMSRFAVDFPALAKFYAMTWGEMMATRITNSKLKAIVSAQWGYYGLPPSKLSCFYYALPFMGYLANGGYYPKGRSQDISDVLAKFIQAHGGAVLLKTKVTTILLEGGAAVGVSTADGQSFRSRAVVSNADPFSTFEKMIGDKSLVADYTRRWKDYSVSLSSFQVFLGLKEDLVGRHGLTDSEVFVDTGYDPELGYQQALSGEVANGGYGVTLYDVIDPSYSPRGKNTLNIMTLQGFGPWEQFAEAYFAGDKAEYRKQKERMADVLIHRAEEQLLPGLSKAIQVKEIGTPLTNIRYTGHPRGAIYGWDQTVNNSGNTRVGHTTPVKNLYLAGAWSRPGHGYGAVIPSGLECFAEIVKTW